jgi:drug/metabolite transporter (DMT)-like permease
MFLGTGVCSIAFFNVCYFACIRECGLSIACILLYTAPCFVTVLSRLLFGEPLTRVKLVALVGAFVGCLLVVGILTGDMNVSAAGLLFGLGSGIGYAFYSIFGRFALERYGSMTVTFYTFLFASLVLLPIGDVGQIATLALGNGFALAVMLLIGMVSTVLPFTCYTNGLRHMETSKASIMAFVEPMVALLIGVLVFHDVLTVGNGIGIVLIVAAVLLLNLAPAKVVEEDQRGA